MDEVEFRAWDEETEQYLYPNLIGVYPDIDGGQTYSCWGEVKYITTNIIEQYSLRKDKNGVKIFQGDKYRFAGDPLVFVVGDLMDFGVELSILGTHHGVSYPYTQVVEVIQSGREKAERSLDK